MQAKANMVYYMKWAVDIYYQNMMDSQCILVLLGIILLCVTPTLADDDVPVSYYIISPNSFMQCCHFVLVSGYLFDLGKKSDYNLMIDCKKWQCITLTW